VRGRFATLARSTTGEAAREYLLVPNAVIAEDEGVLQYAVFVRGRTLERGDSVQLPTLTPVSNTQGAAWLHLDSVDDVVTIAGSSQRAWRWRLDGPGAARRDIWSDEERRLLRVRDPETGIDAVRDDIPRTPAV
jgi:hypothetical protein